MTDATRFGRLARPLVVAVGLAALLSTPAAAQMGGGMTGGAGGLGGPFVGGLLWPLLFFGGIVALGYWAVSGGRERSGDPALESLRTAYARGDLSEEEFEERRRRLEH